MIRLYRTYRNAKDMFVKPILRCRFGLWRHDPGLPIWRRGPILWLCRRKYRSFWQSDRGKKCYQPSDTAIIRVKGDDGSSRFITSKHNLPKGLGRFRYVWSSRIRRRLRKLHLGWFPCCIQLPVFFMFRTVNLDVMWKTKFDEIRFEYPPQFSIIAFGLSLTFWLIPPKISGDETIGKAIPENYWEPLLCHAIEGTDSVKGLVSAGGIWGYKDVSYFGLRKEYLRPEYHEEYDRVTDDIRKSHRPKKIY